MAEPLWVGASELNDLNIAIVAASGDVYALIKPNELDGACSRPRNLWSFGEEDNVAALALSILSGIIRNHPFLEGNRRTALVAARTFLVNNGYDIDVPDSELGVLVRDFGEGLVEESDLRAAFERYLVRRN